MINKKSGSIAYRGNELSNKMTILNFISRLSIAVAQLLGFLVAILSLLTDEPLWSIAFAILYVGLVIEGQNK